MVARAIGVKGGCAYMATGFGSVAGGQLSKVEEEEEGSGPGHCRLR